MRCIFLVGFMGAGKSSVGRELAGRLGCDFVDLDERLAARFGLPIAEVFDVHGEAVFREAEREELARAASLEGAVVAAGGGAFCSEGNRGLIERGGAVSVFLDLPWDVLAERLAADGDSRPLHIDSLRSEALWRARLPDYRRASVVVPLDGTESPGEAASRVAAALEGAVCAI